MNPGLGNAAPPETKNVGAVPTGKDLRAALDALLAGKEVPQPQRPSIGCNIKWKAGHEPLYFNPAGVS